MDVGAFIGVMLGLFFGGLGITYGGYSVHTDYPLIAVLSYVFGAGCVGASVVLTFLRIDGHERSVKLASPSGRTSPLETHQTIPILPIESDPISPAPPRIVVSLPPQELTQFFIDHVTAQAEKLIQPYIGKWLKASGEITDVVRSGDDWIVYVWHTPSVPTPFSHIGLSLYFDKNWSDRVALLSRDITLTVIGQIDMVDDHRIRLKHCEIAS